MAPTFAAALPELTSAHFGQPLAAAELVLLNEPLAEALGLSPQWLRSPAGIAFLSGQPLPEPATLPPALAALTRPVATAYAGHQFGQFAGLLGDGRALLLATLTGPAGLTRPAPPEPATHPAPPEPATHPEPATGADPAHRTGSQVYELQAKGTGRTAFSRGGDGKATLAAALREYLMSEALYALGIPTTRALAVLATGETIARPAQQPFPGQLTNSQQPGGIVVRVASSHLRVGTFELIARIPDSREAGSAASELMRRGLAFAAQRHGYPEDPGGLLQAVVRRQAQLVAQWLGCGFVHGVMNTDNTTISGETIDFGPCAFLDAHRPHAVFSSIDHAGRYAFGAQPRVLGWNLAQLARALTPALDEDPNAAQALAQDILASYPTLFDAALITHWLPKLGLPPTLHDDPVASTVVKSWLELLSQFGPDHTNAHRALLAELADPHSGALVATRAENSETPRDPQWPLAAQSWLTRWHQVRAELKVDPLQSQALLQSHNPAVIARNHLLTAALREATEGLDTSELSTTADVGSYLALHRVLQDPFNPAHDTKAPGNSDFTAPAPEQFGGYRSYCGT